MERFCDPFLWEGIAGDLHEIFRDNVKHKGYTRSSLIYLIHALGFLRMRFKRRQHKHSNMRAIWHNYLVTSWRSIGRNKGYFAINYLGLFLAIVCSLYTFVYVRHELSYDREINRHSDTYRLYKRYINVPEGVDLLTAETSGMMGPTIVEEFPEAMSFVRIATWPQDFLLFVDEQDYTLPNVYFADSSFFDFFNLSLVVGDPKSALSAPSSIVITESTANLLFDDKNPIGQSVTGNDGLPLIVTGVIQDLPSNTHFTFQGLISWTTTVPGIGYYSFNWMNNWLAQAILTYVRLEPKNDPVTLVDKLPQMMNRHFPERADQYFLQLQPWEKIYLFSDNIQNPTGSQYGSFKFILILCASTLLIVIIAVVNCINISLSKITQNGLEVGIRKVMGSTRMQLVHRFVMETLITTVLASFTALITLAPALPQLNLLTGKAMTYSDFLSVEVFIFILIFNVFLSLIIGFYPALMRSKQSVASGLQKATGSKGSFTFTRKSLLGIQYTISIALIICSLVIQSQIEFLQNKELGFNRKNLVVLDVSNEVGEKIEVLEDELSKHPNILSISTSRNAIGSGSYSTTMIAEGQNDDFNLRVYAVDEDFIDTYQIQLIAGRNFLENSRSDSNKVIVNRSLVDFQQWDDPIGKKLRGGQNSPDFTVIGVIEDFHYYSPANSLIEPMVIFFEPNVSTRSTIRLGTGDLQESLVHIENSWEKVASQTPFNFYFIENWYSNLYDSERQVLATTSLYSFISILLSVLGLLGLTALLLQQKKKEISIRKVLGASLRSIINMINYQFMLIMLIGFLIAMPISYLVLDWWLEQFVYQTDLGIWPFIVGGTIVLFGSISITSYMSFHSANTNPSENLNNE